MRVSRILSGSLLVLVLVTAAACVSGNLDNGNGADVVLQILGVDNPPITGEAALGTCSISGSDCLTNDNCPENEVCNPPVAAGECTISAWNVSLANTPLSSGAGTSPFNDVFVSQVVINYFNLNGTPVVGVEERAVQVAVTVPANGAASVIFGPISFDDLQITDDNKTLNLQFRIMGVDGGGESVAVAGGAQLFIEDCF